MRTGWQSAGLLDPYEIAGKIIEIFSQKLEWHHAVIRLYDQEKDAMQILAFNHPGINCG